MWIQILDTQLRTVNIQIPDVFVSGILIGKDSDVLDVLLVKLCLFWEHVLTFLIWFSDAIQAVSHSTI